MKNIAIYDKSTKQLVEELMSAFDALSVPEGQDRLPEIEMVVKKDNAEADLNIVRIAEALAEAYKAGLQAGHIQGLSMTQHDATKSHFWYAKAWTLVHNLCAQQKANQAAPEKVSE